VMHAKRADGNWAEGGWGDGGGRRTRGGWAKDDAE
jgi:hypothetical protein